MLICGLELTFTLFSCQAFYLWIRLSLSVPYKTVVNITGGFWDQYLYNSCRQEAINLNIFEILFQNCSNPVVTASHISCHFLQQNWIIVRKKLLELNLDNDGWKNPECKQMSDISIPLGACVSLGTGKVVENRSGASHTIVWQRQLCGINSY